MNILFIFETPFIASQGGVERVSYLLSEYFRKAGNNTFFLSTCKISKNLPDDSYREDCLFIDPESNDYEIQLNNLLREKNIDIIINQSLTPNAYNFLNRVKNRKIKIVSVLHNQPFATFGKERKYKSLDRAPSLKGKALKYITLIFPSFYRKGRVRHDKKILSDFLEVSDRLLLLSEKYIPRAISFIDGENVNKLAAINNPNTFNSPEDPSLLQKENILLYVGRMVDPQKNLKEFIDIWKIFHKSHPDWKAMIIGDGPHKNIFEKYALSQHVDNLIFLSNRKDVASFYAKSKLLCMTSLYEGWPMVLAEAIAYRCVPFAYDTFEALHEIIINGKNGYILPPFNKRLMAEKLSFLADNDKLRNKMAEFGQKHIELFTIDNIGERWLELLKKL